MPELNQDEFKLFDDSPYVEEYPQPKSYVDQQGNQRSTQDRPARLLRPSTEQVRARRRVASGLSPQERPDKHPVAGGTRTVTHVSKYQDPPHMFLEVGSAAAFANRHTDRARFNDDVIFAADSEETESMRKELGGGAKLRPFTHTYEVPDEVLSEERYADDDLVDTFARSDTPQLWETLNATRQDAVENERVVRFTNAMEAAGSQSYILPKSLVNSGRIKYTGTSKVGSEDATS